LRSGRNNSPAGGLRSCCSRAGTIFFRGRDLGLSRTCTISFRGRKSRLSRLCFCSRCLSSSFVSRHACRFSVSRSRDLPRPLPTVRDPKSETSSENLPSPREESQQKQAQKASETSSESLPSPREESQRLAEQNHILTLMNATLAQESQALQQKLVRLYLALFYPSIVLFPEQRTSKHQLTSASSKLKSLKSPHADATDVHFAAATCGRPGKLSQLDRY